MLDHQIGFIGAGQMATALMRGFVDSGLVSPGNLHVFDPVPAALESLSGSLPGIHVASSNQEVVKQAEAVFLAVKPQVIDLVFGQLQDIETADRLFVSIVAGVPLHRLGSGLRTARVIRVMPNTPCLVGRGASGFSLGVEAKPADAQLAESLLKSVGLAFQVPEPLLDVVTGLSGSGPAFVYMVIEALSDGAVRMGMPRLLANQLATQTVLGAAEMVQSTDEHPAVLKDRVASPGGTTIAGIQALEDSGLRGAMMAAVQAATERSLELGNQNPN